MTETTATGVLLSGGLDSAVLLADMASAGGDVHPIYVAAGDRKSTRLNSSHIPLSRMPSSA